MRTQERVRGKACPIVTTNQGANEESPRSVRDLVIWGAGGHAAAANAILRPWSTTYRRKPTLRQHKRYILVVMIHRESKSLEQSSHRRTRCCYEGIS